MFDKNSKKIFVILITMLFLGLVITPLINANSIKMELENEKENNNQIEESIIQNQYTKKSFGNYIPGEIIVKFKETTSVVPKTVNNFLSVGINSLDQLNFKYNVISSDIVIPRAVSSLSNIYKFTVPESSDILSIIDEYKNDPNVEYAEPNYICLLDNTPNDPLFNKQWHLHNTGQTGGVDDADIDAPEAWDIETGSKDIVIAIIDSGIDYNHPDLSENIWENVDEVADNGIDDDDNGYIDDAHGWDFIRNNNKPFDEFGHGTHCAGIAGAIGNNNIGISGVCWNCSLMPVKVFGKYGSATLGGILKGLYYAAENGADIFSMSWSMGGDTELIDLALEYAYSKGIVLVASAGNSNSKFPYMPAAFDYVISVGAIDKNNAKADFSNYGSWVDVSAPGVDVFSTMPTYPVSLNDYGYTMDYSNMSGTSMSCPVIAGVVGIILSKNGNLEFDKLKTLIQSAVSSVDSNFYIGNGNINLNYCVQNESLPIAILDPDYNGEEAEGSIELSGIASGDTFESYEILIGNGYYPSSWNSIGVFNNPVEKDKLSSIDTLLLSEGFYTLKLEVKDINGNYFMDSISFLVNNIKTTVFVDDNGDKDYKTIQEAANNSGSGDTIFVYNGTYNDNIFIDKSINLIGENKKDTIINGLIYIRNAINIEIKGFTFTQLTQENDLDDSSTYNEMELFYYPNDVEPDQIYVTFVFMRLYIYNCVNTTISDNVFTEYTAPTITSDQVPLGFSRYSVKGIGIYGGGTLITISDNLFKGCVFEPDVVKEGNSPTTAIDISGDNIVIERNTIIDNNVNGSVLYLENLGFFAINNESNACGIEIAIMTGTIRNNIFDNNAKGISCFMGRYTNIYENEIVNNQIGIFLDMGSYLYSIFDNNIQNNSNGIIIGGMCFENEIYRNKIDNNTLGLTTSSTLPFGFEVFAILIGPIYDNTIHHNKIINNEIGLDLESWENNSIENNSISFNTKYGLKLTKSKNNLICCNNFIKNGKLPLKRFDAFVRKGRNKWDNGTAGNYWDNYKGRLFPRLLDRDGDGFGNIPYIVPRLQFDKHPKLEPYNLTG